MQIWILPNNKIKSKNIYKFIQFIFHYRHYQFLNNLQTWFNESLHPHPICLYIYLLAIKAVPIIRLAYSRKNNPSPLLVSVLIPLCKAFDASVEDGLRLVCGPNLELLKVRPRTATSVNVGTLHLGLVNIFPCLLASQHVINLFPFQVHLVLKLGFNQKHIGAGATEEPKVVHRLLCKQYVSTCRTK